MSQDNSALRETRCNSLCSYLSELMLQKLAPHICMSRLPGQQAFLAHI